MKQLITEIMCNGYLILDIKLKIAIQSLNCGGKKLFETLFVLVATNLKLYPEFI